MINNKLLLKGLALCFGIALLYHTTHLVFNIYAKTSERTDLEKYKPAGRGILNSYKHRLSFFIDRERKAGYEIPVEMHLYFTDSIVQATGLSTNNKIENRRWSTYKNLSLQDWSDENVTRFDSIIKIDTLLTRVIVAGKNKINEYDNDNLEDNYRDNVFDVDQSQIYVHSSITVQPKLTNQSILYFLRSNTSILFFIFLFYQLFRIVNLLKSKFSFTSNLHHRINVIGWGLSFFVIFQYILDYIVGNSFAYINLKQFTTLPTLKNAIYIGMTPHYSFNFAIFSTGILLIILSVLIKKSSEIEENWSLTI